MNGTCKIVLRFLCFTGYVLACSSSHVPKVRISSGEISGGYTFTYNDRKLYSFLGIPYASPPVQDYRFKVLKITSLSKKLNLSLKFYFEGTSTSKTLVRRLERLVSWKCLSKTRLWKLSKYYWPRRLFIPQRLYTKGKLFLIYS